MSIEEDSPTKLVRYVFLLCSGVVNGYLDKFMICPNDIYIYIYIHIIQLYPVFGYVYYHLNQHMAYPFKPYLFHDISPHPPRPPRWLPQQNPGRVLVVSTTWGGAVWIIKNMGLGYNYTRVYHMGLQIGYKVYIYI